MERYAPINDLLGSSGFFYTIIIGVSSTYTYVSPSYDRNFGFGKGSLKGQHFSVTLHPDDVKICEETGPKCFESPDRLFPVQLRKHDGKGGFVTTQWEMQGILDESGIPLGIFCIGYNITELIVTQNKLGEAETQLDEISFIQSHNVRKPLANIISLSSMIADENDLQTSQKLADMLLISANELDKVVKDISKTADNGSH